MTPRELGFTRIEEADALPAGETVSHQHTSPYVIHRKAQIAALLDFWHAELPGTTATPDGLVKLMAEAGNNALPVAEMIAQTADRIESGQEIKAPWGYIRSALKNQREKQQTQPATQSNPAYHDPDELLPMTPELQAQFEEAKAIAAKYNLWGDE